MKQNELLEALGESTNPAILEEKFPSQQSYNREEVIKLARGSLDFLASLALPAVTTFSYPPELLAVWHLLTTRAHLAKDFSKLAIGIPRGFTKTTLLKLFILYAILFTDRKFFLIIGATAARAENILSDVADMLSEPNVFATFGNWKLAVEKDTQAEKVFGFRGRSIILVALGAGSSLRGINRKNARPDFILMDDMQTRENAKSPVLSNELLEWMVGTLMKTKSNARCLFAFVGNMYPFPGSILRKLRKDASWTSLIVGGLLADGTSLWPELRSREDLLEEFSSDLALGKPEIFLAEVLNDENASVTSVIDITAIPMEPIGLDSYLPQAKFIVIDPSGRKKNSDKTAIGYFEVFDGTPLLKELKNEIMTPGQTIKEALILALEHGCFLIAVESTAYQETLLYWFERTCENLGIEGIDIVDIYTGAFSKNARIRTMLEQLVQTAQHRPEILIADKLRAVVLNQIAQWNPLTTDNVDDVLDLLCYAPKVVGEYGHLAAARGIANIDDSSFSQARVRTLAENTNF